MDINVVALVSRILHMLPAIVLVGGLVYQRLVYVPAIGRMTAAERDELQTAMRRPWALLVMVSTLLLLASGLYNTARISIDYQLPPAYHALLGIKILLALAIFALSALLTGKTNAAVKMRQNQAFWLNVNLALAVVLVCLAGVMRMVEKNPKSTQPPAEAAISAPFGPTDAPNAFFSAAAQISLMQEGSAKAALPNKRPSGVE